MLALDRGVVRALRRKSVFAPIRAQARITGYLCISA
jgi:hypothetical protein